MSIEIFITGFSACLAGWLLHFAWWRLSRPVDDLRALVACLIVFPAAVLVVLFLLGTLTLQACFLSLILSTGLGSAYIFWYPAAQAASPTMLMTVIVARAGESGCSEEALQSVLTEETLSGNSLESLVGERFASEDTEGKLELAPRGQRTLKLIRLLRHSAGFEDPKG
ncbi:MAG: hypothetical protein AB3N33_05230 [Puniceicoccaceae bacterium]